METSTISLDLLSHACEAGENYAHPSKSEVLRRIVDEMDLDIFLQVVGCGIYNPELDDLLATGSNLLVSQVRANLLSTPFPCFH